MCSNAVAINVMTMIHPDESTSSGLGNLVALQTRSIRVAASIRRRKVERRAVIWRRNVVSESDSERQMLSCDGRTSSSAPRSHTNSPYSRTNPDPPLRDSRYHANDVQFYGVKGLMVGCSTQSIDIDSLGPCLGPTLGIRHQRRVIEEIYIVHK